MSLRDEYVTNKEFSKVRRKAHIKFIRTKFDKPANVNHSDKSSSEWRFNQLDYLNNVKRQKELIQSR